MIELDMRAAVITGVLWIVFMFLMMNPMVTSGQAFTWQLKVLVAFISIPVMYFISLMTLNR